MSRRDREASAWFARMRGPEAAKHSEAFAAWRADPANAAAYADAEADWLMAAGVSRAHVAAHGETRTVARSVPMRWALATVAAAAIALGFGSYLKPSEKLQLAEQMMRQGATELPDRSTMALADGARAEIRYTPHERRILLFGGRARFAVAHDPARPFVVEAKGSETIALGTEFEVDLSSGPVLVRLIKGAVEVRATGTTSKVRLVPGERAAVANRAVRIVPTSETSPSASLVDADRLALASVVERANRINKTPIRLADPAFGKLQLSGRFDLSDSARLARKLAVALDLEVEPMDEVIILTAKPRRTGE